jgi:N-acetylneuraminic acid mutarotase
MHIIFTLAILTACVSSVDNSAQEELKKKTYAVSSVARSSSPRIRSFHHSLWTGESMIVLGGDVKQSISRETSVGGIYFPESNLWRAIKSPFSNDISYKYQSSVWTGKKVILWGGFDYGDDAPVNKGYAYNYKTGRWKEISNEGAPSARSGHSAIWFKNKMYVFGGYDEKDFLSSVHSYDPREDLWSELADLPENIDPRAYATAKVFNDKVYLWGGMNAEGTINTGWIFDPSQDLWEKMAENEELKGRISFTSVVTNDSMIIWGGQESLEETQAISDGWSYSFETNSWMRLTDTGKEPRPRMHHAAVWTGEKMVVFGGASKGRVYRSGLFYSPSERKWARMEIDHKVKQRYGHSMIWTGNDLVVWGGFKTTKTGVNNKFVSRKSKGFIVSIQDDLEAELETDEEEISH